jgi:hypothetical protein
MRSPVDKLSVESADASAPADPDTQTPDTTNVLYGSRRSACLSWAGRAVVLDAVLVYPSPPILAGQGTNYVNQP